jgi:glucose/arabinose dehydrogenase
MFLVLQEATNELWRRKVGWVADRGGMALVNVHPDYEKNGWIYLGYSDGTREGGKPKTITTYVRGKVKDGEWSGQELIWKADEKFYTDSGVHFGTRLAFDGKGHIYFPVGERGGWMEAQDVANPKGKIFRLHEDGQMELAGYYKLPVPQTETENCVDSGSTSTKPSSAQTMGRR